MSSAPQFPRPQSVIRREITAAVRVLDDKEGIAEYVASDETVDSFGEVIRVNGWRFNRFSRNAPFVDSHRYGSVEDLLGSVLDFEVKRGRLIETVQWAIDVPSNQRARIGWEMTRAGYLKAVSVGFQPIRMASRWDNDKSVWHAQLRDLGLTEQDGVRAVYLEQEQLELSAVILGANPNSLVNVGKAYRDGVIRDSDFAYLTGSRTAAQRFPTSDRRELDDAVDRCLAALRAGRRR